MTGRVKVKMLLSHRRQSDYRLAAVTQIDQSVYTFQLHMFYMFYMKDVCIHHISLFSTLRWTVAVVWEGLGSNPGGTPLFKISLKAVLCLI